MRWTLYKVFFDSRGTWNQKSRQYLRTLQDNQNGRYILQDNTLTCTCIGDTDQNNPMWMVHAHTLGIHRTISRLIALADRKFEVTTKVNKREYAHFLTGIPQNIHQYDGDGGRTNRKTIEDIKDWVKKVGPLYTNCFITEERFTKEDHLYDTVSCEMTSIENALAANHENVVVISEAERGVLNRSNISSLDKDKERRTPCKVRGSLDPANMFSKTFIDFKKAGLGLSHFVSESDFDAMQDSHDRLYAMIPSFEIFMGLASDSAINGITLVSAMHCVEGEYPRFQTSFLFPCGKDADIELPKGKTCVSNEKVYKISSNSGECEWPTQLLEELDDRCCVISRDEINLQYVMTCFARKTTTDTGDFSFLSDIYKWYEENVGKIKAYDSKLVCTYPANEEEGWDLDTVRVFTQLKPRVMDLHVYASDDADNEPFDVWYDKVNTHFVAVSDSHIVRLTHQGQEEYKITGEKLENIVQNRPKSELHLELGRQYFANVNNELGRVLLAVYRTENFVLDIHWNMQGDEKMGNLDPTPAILKSGFKENLEAQRLTRPEGDDLDNDEFEDGREFHKDHMKVELEYTNKYISLRLQTSHKFE